MTAVLTPRRFALVFGTGLLALGVVGFAATGLRDPFLDHGATVLGLGINPASSVLHVATGLSLLLVGTSGTSAARHAATLTTSSYLVLGLLGLVLHGSTANVLGVNLPTVVLHLLTGVAAGLAAHGGASDRASLRNDGSEPRAKAT